MKRICLFAAYNYRNTLLSYVTDYVRELANHCDVYYMADGKISKEQLSPLIPYTKDIWTEQHTHYDFGSFVRMVQKIGWDTISQYDELILANDSCMCVNPFAPVFAKMDKNKLLDFWGLLASDCNNIDKHGTVSEFIKHPTKTTCFNSFFLGIRKKAFTNKNFQHFFATLGCLKNRQEVFIKAELGIFKYFREHNAIMDCYEPKVYSYSTAYMRQGLNLLKNGFPLLKVRIFTDNLGGHKSMEELAFARERYCAFPFFNKAKEIQRVRPTNIEKLKKLLNKYQDKKRQFIPPFIRDIVKLPQRLFYPAKKRNSDRKTAYFLPPILLKQYKKYKNNRFYKTYHSPEYLRKLQSSDSLVLFFNVMRPAVSGGMLSIDRFVQHSLKFEKEGNFTVVQTGLPFENELLKNPFFNYSLPPIDFDYVSAHTAPKKAILNIPEVFIIDFVHNLTKEMLLWLWNIEDLRINVLNQADTLMPPTKYLEQLAHLCNYQLTITAAHQRYATPEKEQQYGFSVHLLTPFLPEFKFTEANKKEKIIVLSPDYIPQRIKVKDLLQHHLPDYKLVTVKNMHLEQYKQLIARAMFTISFGEGYDGYFIEPHLSGSLAFTVWNDLFFPINMKKTPTLYKTWEELFSHIIQDIARFSANPELYTQTVKQTIQEIRKFTNNLQAEKDLRQYYQRFSLDFKH